MILTKTINYYNKKVPIESLSRFSNKKVSVMCLVCGDIRDAYYKVVVDGNTICHKCACQKQRKYLKSNNRYNRLVVIKSLIGKSLCKCDCGNEIVVDNYSLKTGHTKSCGCLQSENFQGAKVNKGDKHGNWQGGVSGKRNRAMQSTKYRRWREDVYKRDNYTCQKCKQIGYQLNAHHVFSYSEHKNKRYDIFNGVTFCKDCHFSFHKIYGRKKINQDQLKKFCNCNDQKINNPLKEI